jgi:CubicO group peptidase (beta-lactamase class C family)
MAFTLDFLTSPLFVKDCLRAVTKRVVTIVLVGTLGAWISGCGLNDVGGGGSSSPNFGFRQSYPWPISTPGAQGLDPARISAGLQQIQANPFILSVLIVRNDSLVAEYYASGIVDENDFQVSGISASITSALVGIAIDKGIIRSAQERVLNYFPGFDTTRLDPRKREWTIEHLLAMRSGIDWNEDEDHSKEFNSQSNWLSTALRLPLKSSPGDAFVYTTPNANLLSGILARASGSSTNRFAETGLFGPLRISVRAWATDPQDVYLGGTGMRLTPRDLARLGQLYLHNGLIDGKQIVPRAWVQQSITPRNAQNSVKGDLSSINFGNLWWTNYDGRDSLFVALGFGGQAIYVVPAKNIVIVTIGDSEVPQAQGNANERVIIGIVKKYFL